MIKKLRYRIPDLSRIESHRIQWDPQTQGQKSPYFVPTEPVHKQLCIPEKSSVRVIAGAWGHWAARLAPHTTVDYSDISPAMVALAHRHHSESGIRSFEAADALFWPEEKKYGYVVAAEPYPLEERLPLIALKAIARGTSVRFVNSTLQAQLFSHYGDTLQSSVEIRGMEAGETKTKKFDVVMVNPFPTGRHLAKLDLQIINFFQGRPASSFDQIRAYMQIQGVRVSEEQVRNSLERIHALSTVIEGTHKRAAFTTSVSIDRTSCVPVKERFKE